MISFCNQLEKPIQDGPLPIWDDFEGIVTSDS